MKLSLRERIKKYFENHAGEKISGGEFERMVANKTLYKPSNTSRRLRELVEDGFLKASYDKGYVEYQYATTQ